MVSVFSQRGKFFVNEKLTSRTEVRCLSKDDKPTNVSNGTPLIEIDTGKLFLFDADSSTWKEV